MKKFTAMALALMVGVAAQAQVTTSEKTVKTETNTNGAVRSTTEHRSETNVNAGTATTVNTDSSAYVTRLESAYKYAGVPQADIVRLRDIDRKVWEVRRTDPNVKIDEYYVQQSKILAPAQVTKVRTYLKEHPAPATVPAHVVTTYEAVPAKAGVEINTPLGSVGVGVPAGSTVVEKKTVVPAQP